VLKERFDVQLDKAMQRSDWGKRPLSDQQIAYARLDTHFLLPLMHAQRGELDEQDRAMIVAGECARLERLEPADAPFEPNEFVRLKGARALAPIERQVLRELFTLRETLASASDQPPFRIVNNEVLVRLAQRRPKGRRDLADVAGFSHKQIKRMGDEVLAAVRKAEELGPLQRLPSLPSKDGTGELGDDAFELHERLKRWRKERAAKLGIESGYLVNRHVLLALAKQRPTSPEALAAIDGVLAWQLERFGEELVALMRGFERDLAAGKVEPSRRRGR
jgi:ribonuclease D